MNLKNSKDSKDLKDSNMFNNYNILVKAIVLGCLVVLLMSMASTNVFAAPGSRPTINSSIINVNGITFDKTGNNLASARNDGVVTLWSITNKAVIRELASNSSLAITGVAFDPNGTTLATSSRDSVLRLWDTSSNQIRKELFGTGEAGWILAVAYSPNGKTIATAGADTKVILWDADSMSLKVVLAGHKGFVRSVSFSPDGKILASSSDDGTVRIWDANIGREILPLRVGNNAVNTVVFNPNSKSIATGSSDGSIKEFNAANGQLIRTYVDKGTNINVLAYSPDGSMLTGAGDDGSIRTWRVSNGVLTGKASQGTNVKVNSISYSPNGLIVASAGDGAIKIWNTKTWKDIFALVEQKTAKSPVFNNSVFNNSINSTIATTINPKVSVASSLTQGGGGPILLITSAGSTNPFGNYYTEILRNEGFNAFQVADISTVTSTTLSNYDIAILAEMTLDSAQVSMLSNWVNGGGRLIAMRPDPQLGGLLGISGPSGTIDGAYLLVNTTDSPGKGIVDQTIQYKGVADRYNLNGATSIATLYSNANTPTTNPVVTIKNVGNGQAAAFTYDLARSIVYMRQGNPAWDFEERDGYSPIRPDDLFYGAAVLDPRADWIDLNKVAIPQADEQQRLLANMIIEMTKSIKPLPRFWYLPHGFKAAIIMTGDDHGNGGTAGRFDQYISLSPANCNVGNWECIRSTSYIYTGTPLTNAKALSYQNKGFEIGLHVNSNCADYGSSTQEATANLESIYTDQLSNWQTKYSSITPPRTNRMHCIAWDGWSVQASVELNHGIRLDTSYYYWPPAWLADRIGFFTASGMPMRFSDLNGNLVDVYQATTQMTDESGQSYPFTPDSLLDNAIGPEEYFGVFTVNAHTDQAFSSVSDAVVSSALARNIPIVSSRQMLDWIDGRDNSIYSGVSWNGGTLSFSVAPATGANGLQVMVPANTNTGSVSSVNINGNPANYAIKTINGIGYAFIDAISGTYSVAYSTDSTPPTVVGNTPASGATGVGTSTQVNATFSEILDATTINNGSFELHLDGPTGALVPADVSYNDLTSTATLTPSSPLAFSKNYTVILKGGTNGVKDLAGNALASDYVWSFSTASGPTCPCSIWYSSATPVAVSVYDPSAVELGVKFRSDINGQITGLRFYKGATNTGTHVGTIWSSSGNILGQVTFTGESSSGWQQANFNTPVNVTAGTTYIASYHTNVGFYSGDNYYFASSGIDNAPLHALKDGFDGGDGIYNYITNPAFPSDTWLSSNYWVDIVFVNNNSHDTTPPNITGVSPASGATSVDINTTITATFNEAINSTTINTNTFELHVGNLTGPLISANVNYNGTNFVATLQPSSQLASSTNYTAVLKGGSNGVKDVAGNALLGDYTWSFTTSGGTIQYSLEPAGWFAGDMHAHRSCGGTPIAISDMYQKLFPQNLTFMSLLADSGDGEVQDPVQDLPRVNGSDDPISTTGKIVHWDAENHWDPVGVSYPQKNLGDHIVTLGLKEAHQIYVEYSYPILNWAHQQNGIAGFAHFQYLDNNIPQTLTCCTPIEYPVEVALGSADFISEDDFGSESFIQAYYRLLNTGFRPGFAAGTDSPCNNPNVGSLLTYVMVGGGQPTYKDWINGIAKGRTVVSRNGHNEFLNFTVNSNAIPGDEINLTGGGNVPVTIIWTANQPLSGTIELVSNGVVVASKQTSVDSGTPASLTATVNFTKSGWLAARRMGPNGHNVHTGAVFVTVDNKPVRASLADAQFYVQWMDNLLQKTSPGGPWNQYFINNLSDAQARYQAAKAIYQQIALEADTTPPIITGNTPSSGATGVGISTPVTVTFNEAMNVTTIHNSTFELHIGNETGTLVPSSVSYNPSTFVATLQPSSILANLTNYTVIVKGGVNDPRVKDLTGNALASNYIWSFTTASGLSYSIWNASAVPVNITKNDSRAIELGVKFRSDVSGNITGIRFYKGLKNTGTHVGTLWTRTGTRLGRITFLNETTSGWQQANFATPIAINANMTYVASYHTNVGNYSEDDNYFKNSGVDNPPLHALKNGVDGSNGVYVYNANPAFPNKVSLSSNYWVDVVFKTVN